MGLNFGFKSFRGRTIELKVLGPDTHVLPRRAISNVRDFVVKTMNKHGREAAKIAKRPSHSPFLTGHLVKNIQWEDAKSLGLTRVIIGRLGVDLRIVPYARRQEYEHRTKGRYLLRAMAIVFPKFATSLNKRGVWENLVLGKRHFTEDFS